jgi:GH15 family glucan-1,4-alpha-glucosidase
VSSAPAAIAALAGTSLDLIEACQHPSGAYPACPDYPVYRFSWLRDGSFIADAMSRAGRPASADAFFGWCAGIINARAERIAGLVARAEAGEQVADTEMLPTRYTLDGEESDEPWENFQLDGYGAWLWALREHRTRHPRTDEPLADAVATTVDYLVAFGHRPCFDWWEEQPTQRHVSTLAAVAAGLRAAAGLLGDPHHAVRATEAATNIESLINEQGIQNGHLTKWLGNTAVDGSLLCCLTAFGTVQPGSPVAEATYARVLADLRAEGVYRYRGDTFYGGGEWLILTAWLGWYESLTGREEEARTRLGWVAAQATPDGLLPEQVSGHTQDPVYIPQWTRRWGPVATPLLWSHAMFLTLAVESKVWSPS